MIDGLNVTLSGDLSAKLDKLAAELRGPMLEKALTAGALLVANDAKRRARYKTGNLRRSIHVGGNASLTGDFGGGGKDYGDIGKPQQPSDGAAVQVGTNLVYAAIHEFGGVITPKNAKVLRFKIGDKWVMAKRVTIPARPYLRPALDENTAAVQAEVATALGKLLDAALA